MSIPKTIHYCWFGGNPLPPFATKCIASWKKYCPDYEIVQWDESNFDVAQCPQYVQEAYAAKKWAFVSDYARLKIIYENGGIYLDTDVTLLKGLDDLLTNQAYFGREDDLYINTGLGFGAEPGVQILRDLMDDYANAKFDTTACPLRNTPIFERYGLATGDTFQILTDGTAIYPIECFNPKNPRTGLTRITENSYSVHDYSATWYSSEELKSREKFRRKNRMREYKRLPYKIARKILGVKLYEAIKSRVKKR